MSSLAGLHRPNADRLSSSPGLFRMRRISDMTKSTLGWDRERAKAFVRIAHGRNRLGQATQAEASPPRRRAIRSP